MLVSVVRDKATKTCTISAQMPNEKSGQITLSDTEIFELGSMLGSLYAIEEIEQIHEKSLEPVVDTPPASSGEETPAQSGGEEVPPPAPEGDTQTPTEEPAVLEAATGSDEGLE